MKSFEYAFPGSVAEAVDLLGSSWDESEVLAGGTDLITALKQDITAPKRVVSLKGVAELKGINVTGDTVHVGAMTTLAELAGNADIRKHFPALVTAIRQIGSPQIINAGTVGGDLLQRPRCWYFRTGFGLLGQHNGKALVPEGDNRYHAIFDNKGPAYFVNPSSLAPGLIALGATVTITGPGGKSRSVPVAGLYRTPSRASERENTLSPAEILTGVSIPVQGLRNAVYEVRQRQGLDWPLVAAAAAFKYSGGKASNVHIVLGHVAPTPWTSTTAADAVEGRSVDDATAALAGKKAAQGARPLSGNAYKVQLVKAAVTRAVLAAAG